MTSPPPKLYDLDRLARSLWSAPPPVTADELVVASVAILLRERAPGDEAEMFLIERAVREGDLWSGHMAFPGGRRDPSDVDLFATAVRETREEVGFDLEHDATFLARLSDVRVHARAHSFDMRVASFVFALRGDAVARLNHEVADTLWTSVGSLARGETAGSYAFTWEGVDLDMPCYRLGERVVWGLTYMMIERLLEVVHREG